MKRIKKYFSHGDICYTGSKYYILKHIIGNKKVWRECYLDECNKLKIPFEYIQSNGYLHYINNIISEKISMLPLDNSETEFYNHEEKYLFPEPTTQWDIADEYLDKDVKKYNETYDDNLLKGIMRINDEKFQIKTSHDTWVDLVDNFINNEYISDKGIRYYAKIAQEFESKFKVLISPFEILHMPEMKIEKIDIKVINKI